MVGIIFPQEVKYQMENQVCGGIIMQGKFAFTCSVLSTTKNITPSLIAFNECQTTY
jgi:hypothetical protein